MPPMIHRASPTILISSMNWPRRSPAPANAMLRAFVIPVSTQRFSYAEAVGADHEHSFSPPLVFWVFSLQFAFNVWIMLAPETGQVLGYLHRTPARRQDMHQNRDAPECNAGCCIHVEQFLDPQ